MKRESDFVDIKVWFTSKSQADVMITRLTHGERLSKTAYVDVSRASVYRLINLAEGQDSNYTSLFVYW